MLTGVRGGCTGDCPPEEEEEEGWGQGTEEGLGDHLCVVFLAWAVLGWLWEGWAVGAAWGRVQLMDQEGSGKHHSEPVPPPPFLGCEMCSFQSSPVWVITGQVRIFLIDSILVGFSALLPCCLGCVV